MHIRRGDTHKSMSRYMALTTYWDLMRQLKDIYNPTEGGDGGSDDRTGTILWHVFAEVWDHEADDTKQLHYLFSGHDDIILHDNDRDLETFMCMVTAEGLVTSLGQFSAMAAELRTGPTFRWRTTTQMVANRTYEVMLGNRTIELKHPRRTRISQVVDMPHRHFGFRNDSSATQQRCLAHSPVAVPILDAAGVSSD